MASEKKQYNKLVKAYMNTGDPITEAGFGEQATSLEGQYQDSMALLKYQRAQLRSQGKNQRADIRQQGQYDLQSAAGAALERGILGGSADVSARQQVKASTGAALTASRDTLTQNLAANLATSMAERRNYQSGIISLLQQRAANKAMGGASAYLDKIYDALAGENADNGGPNGGGPNGGGPNGKGGNNENTGLNEPGPWHKQIAGAEVGGNEIEKLFDFFVRKRTAAKEKLGERGEDWNFNPDKGPYGKFYRSEGEGPHAGIEYIKSINRWHRLANLAKLRLGPPN